MEFRLGIRFLDASCAVDTVLGRSCTPFTDGGGGGVVIVDPPNESDEEIIFDTRKMVLELPNWRYDGARRSDNC